MINWSVDEEAFKIRDPEAYRLWRITQLINYGLDGEKLDEAEVREAWPKIVDRLDPYKARYLEFALWGRQFSLPNNLTFWNSFVPSPVS